MENLSYVLITGATGFTGSYVVAALRQDGYKVRALVRDISSAPKFLTDDAEIDLVEGSMEDTSSLRKATAGVSAVIHIAAAFRKAGFPDSYFYSVNTTGTRALLDAAIESGATRFLHCSTVGVHSNSTVLPTDETAPYSPGDIYQESKMEGEKIALEYLRSGKISGLVIRPGMIYGPGDMRTLKLFKMVAERKFFYVGPGDAFVHFIDVRDLARAFVLALKRTDINGEIFIIAGQKALRLRTMVEFVASCFEVRPPSLHLPIRPMQLLGSVCEAVCKPFGIEPPLFRRRVDFFTKDRCFDTSKAQTILGFTPQQSYKEEIRDIITWYRENNLISAPTQSATSTLQLKA